MHGESAYYSGDINLPSDLANLQARDLFAKGTIAYNHSSVNDSEGAEAREYIINVIGSLANIAHSKFPMKRSLVIAQVINESGWVHEVSSPLVREYNNVLGLNNYAALRSPETTWYKKGQKTQNVAMSHPNGYTNDPAKVFDNLYECIEDYMGQFVYHHPASSFGDYENYENYRTYLAGYTEDPVFERYRNMIQTYNLDRFDSMPDRSVNSTSSDSQNGETVTSEDVLMIVGNTRVAGMQETVSIEGTDIVVSQRDGGAQWLESEGFTRADNNIVSGMSVIIWTGIDDLENSDAYIEAINKKANEWNLKNVKVYYANVGPVDNNNRLNVTNAQIEKFNKKMQDGLSSEVNYIDVYNYLKGSYETVSGGIIYKKATNQKVYDYFKRIMRDNRQAQSTDNNTNTNNDSEQTLESCYFKTGIEGLYLFMSQYSWNKFFAQNMMYIVCGFLLTLFKYFLYGLFLARMAIMAILVAFVPIAIIINAFMRMSGNKGILRNWFKIYLFLIFLKPIIQLIYYVLVKANPYLVTESPFYILVPIIVITAGVIVSSILILNNLTGGKIRRKSKKA